MPDITTVILIKESAMGTAAIDTHYLQPLAKEGIPTDAILIKPLYYNNAVKVYAKTAKAYLDKLLSRIPDTVINLIIADSSYYKFITGAGKVSTYYGTTIKGKHDGYSAFNCVYVPNYKTLFKQPENSQLIDLGLKAIAGTGTSVLIKTAQYGFEYGSDRELLDSLHKYPVLAADIETTGLTLYDQIVSVSFAWSKHDGIAIDLSITGMYYLRKFLQAYTGKLIFHGGLYDGKMLIRHLWMEHGTDYAGMLEGLKYFKDIDDTMLLAFIAKNATTHVGLGLKELALDYVGNYAIEIEDITKYTKQEILQYNLIDTLGTFYLWEKYQDEITSRPYVEIFQPSIYPILKMMLVGLPMDSDRVKEVNQILAAKQKILNEQIQDNSCVMHFNILLRKKACDKNKADRAERILQGVKVRTPVKTIDAFQDIEFNPRSPLQIGQLFFDTLGLPVLEKTKTGAPSTSGDILENLANHTTNQNVIDLLEFIRELAEANKINGTFIKAFMQEKDFLHGSLKLGGAQSGRLSSSDPNLTNLPAHGPMGKLTKSCIVAPGKKYTVDSVKWNAILAPINNP
jgi:DNA polymerase I